MCIECPQFGIEIKGACYIVNQKIDGNISWNDAQNECNKIGSDLTDVDVDVDYWFEFWDYFLPLVGMKNSNYYVTLYYHYSISLHN